MSNKLAPHKAIINIKAEVYETLPNGKSTGRAYKLDSKMFVFDGKNFEEAKSKAKHFMENLSCKKEK